MSKGGLISVGQRGEIVRFVTPFLRCKQQIPVNKLECVNNHVGNRNYLAKEYTYYIHSLDS